MSAARYTAMRRTIATANLTKVHYPTNIAKNYDPLYSTIGCNPRFSLFTYLDPPCCKIPPPIVCSVFYDGLFSSTTEFSLILDGKNSQLNNFQIVSGETSSVNCTIRLPPCLFYDGLSAKDNYLPPFNGLQAQDNDLPPLDGKKSQSNCEIALPSCLFYDGLSAKDNYLASFNGLQAQDNNLPSLDGETSLNRCLSQPPVSPCVFYSGISSQDITYLPLFDGLQSENNKLRSLDGEFSFNKCSLPALPPPPTCTNSYDGLFSQTVECIFILDAANSNANNLESYNSGDSTNICILPIPQCLFYDALFARNNYLPSFNSLDSQDNNLSYLDGQGSKDLCTLPVICNIYNGNFSSSETSYNIDGGSAEYNNFYTYDAKNSRYVCSSPCAACISYNGGSSSDNYLPGLDLIPTFSVDGQTSSPCAACISYNGGSSSDNYLPGLDLIPTFSVDGQTSSYICSCFSRC